MANVRARPTSRHGRSKPRRRCPCMTQAPTKQCPEGVGPRMSFISRFSCNCRGDGMLHLGLDPERLQASCWKASTSLTYASASCSPSRQTRSTHHGTGKSEAAGDLSPRTFALGSERAFLQVACALSMALSFAAPDARSVGSCVLAPWPASYSKSWAGPRSALAPPSMILLLCLQGN